MDDDEAVRVLMTHWLVDAGFGVVPFSAGAPAMHAPIADVVCLDLGLGDMPGMHVLSHLRARDVDATVVVITGEKRIDTAVAAMRGGAYDYLTKPLDRERFITSVERAFERRVMAVRIRTLSSRIDERGTVIGQSAAIRDVMEQISRVTDSDVAVCVVGESGSGKELVARAIHNSGRRRNGAFVAINCAAIPESLQESELFGHERGAFTGATFQKPGRFEQAHHGTLFLDEVGEMSAATQAAMLRTLQERVVRRVGATTEIPVDVRVVCATHRDLEAEVRAGRFREDLYFRLVVYPIRVPPLRERDSDIPMLVGHLLRKLVPDVGREISRVSPEAMSALLAYRWPGNVRELENVIHRAMLACDKDEIALAHLPPAVRATTLPDAPAPSSAVLFDDEDSGVIPLRELERRAIERALRVANGSVGKAAKLLGMGRATLYRRLAELGDLRHTG